ncbi:MAG TPA: hypothetical protein VFS76_04670 [Pyrinomonadaceae bacterium]|nr:hypothetical protein [Pyrinomonadaceae bacterium]
MRTGKDPQLVREYLLRALDEHRQAEFEEQLLDDANLQAEIAEAQHDLIDDYVFGLLNDRERALFEQNFALSDERLHIMRLSEAMLKYTESNPLESSWQRSLRFLKEHRLAAACIAIIALAAGYGLWTIYNYQQVQKQLAALQAQRLSVEKELARLNAGQLPDSAAKAITVILRPLLRDAGEPSQARIESNTEVLKVRLELIESNYPSYQAIIETSERAEMYRVPNLKPETANGKTLLIILPAQLLPVGSYQIHLIGITSTGQGVDCGKYPFQVVH